MAGIAIEEAELCSTGFKNDRRWMLVDSNNKFVSQRELPLLCLFKTKISPKNISITYLNNELTIPCELQNGIYQKVTIWEDEVDSIVAPNFINEWFSLQTKTELKLVYMPDTASRLVENKFAPKNQLVSFADGYPLLLIGQASIDFLESKSKQSIDVNRFRPNIVIKGEKAHEEDSWKEIQIQNIKFNVVKPCARCVITTINQTNAKVSTEPLKTLSTYRKKDNKILFGQNLIGPSSGIISVGDLITVVK